MFVIRAWTTTANAPPEDQDAGDDLRAAIVRAAELAEDKRYRSVCVTDSHAMVWAQFNMLWLVPRAG
jgi:alkanesulfonate monooxygenase SsuD/methylene tetrahydromethanopterin reductase-like flavin-dependent oxidoreductase (luciferase family)